MAVRQGAGWRVRGGRSVVSGGVFGSGLLADMRREATCDCRPAPWSVPRAAVRGRWPLGTGRRVGGAEFPWGTGLGRRAVVRGWWVSVAG